MNAITPRDLQGLLRNRAPQAVLLDVREAWEFAICRIEGSRNVPTAQISSVLPELDQHTPTVVICHHGLRSAEVAEIMAQAGFEHVSNLEGGIDKWAREVDPDMPTY